MASFEDWEVLSDTSSLTADESSWDMASISTVESIHDDHSITSEVAERLDGLSVHSSHHSSHADYHTIASQSTCCPLTLDRIRQPTLCEVDGKVYEYEAIYQWVLQNGNSPFTREPVCMGQLRRLDLPDDDISISTQSGWPRLHQGSAPHPSATLKGREGPSPQQVALDFLSALLNGGGGVESDRAITLSKKKKAPSARPVSRKRHAKRGSPSDSAEEDEELSDLVYADLDAKMSRARSILRKRLRGGRMGRGRHAAKYRVAQAPALLPGMATVYEESEEEEGFSDDDFQY